MIFALGVYLSLWASAAYARNPLVINLNYSLDPLPPGCDCNGTNFDSSLTEEYLCGDRRLGPMNFTYTVDDEHPRSPPGAETWSRLGGLCPGEFLEKWTDKSGWFIDPPADGFQLDSQNHPITKTVTLCPDQVIVRFGSEEGSIMSWGAFRFEDLALPPLSLVDEKGPNSAPMNFHGYKVLKPMQVTGGCTAPWFEQPGLATQYVINGSVEEAIREGFLEKWETETHLGGPWWMWEDEMWEMIRKKAEREELRASQGDTCEWPSLNCPGDRLVRAAKKANKFANISGNGNQVR
ncbi:hypothetical protein E4U14_004004 [Claviceps sp. LM454 group G7]|nr:hypothetical protein E4U14_004004 [Claviceps sp. LM454 group G7]